MSSCLDLQVNGTAGWLGNGGSEVNRQKFGRQDLERELTQHHQPDAGHVQSRVAST
ncbi:MAG TPA: hypothetical protein VIT43_01010 [Candidatus Dormibacteraeota bacterium]